MSGDLTALLLEALDAEQEIALAAPGTPWNQWGREVWLKGTSARTGDYPVHEISDRWPDWEAAAIARYIARQSPAHTLRRVAALRRIVERHRKYCHWCHEMRGPLCSDLLDLADALGVEA